MGQYGAAREVQAAQPSSQLFSLGQEIFDAIRRGDETKVRTLVEGDPLQVKARNVRQSTPLHVAVDSNNLTIARYLIENGADPNAVNAINWTPLFCARNALVAGLLAESGADVNLAAGDITPLAHSVYRGERDLAEFLLAKGARIPALQTPIGQMSMIRALRLGSLRYFEEGLRQGLDPLHVHEGGSLWLHYAAESRSAELVVKLVTLGTPVDRRNAFGLTPLHVAASRGNTTVVGLLIRQGADRNARTNDGMTPFNLASEEGRGETAALLKSLGADQSPRRFPTLTGEYLGQPRPGRKPVLFAPGILSGRRTFHGWVVAISDGTELYWSVGPDPGVSICRASRRGGRWTEPEAFSDGDVPFVSPAGGRSGGSDAARSRSASGRPWSRRPLTEESCLRM